MPVAGMARRHHAVEHVDTAQHGGDDVLGATHAHEVAGTVGGHAGHEMFEDGQALGLGFAHGEAAHGEPRQVEGQQRLE